MQVRARSWIQPNISTIKLQTSQGGETEEAQEIKTAAEDPARPEAANHETGTIYGQSFLDYLDTYFNHNCHSS